ncbi:Rieske (2Fe-2S) protein [Prosthecochloris sp. HL-130-GSB]|jgi:nitrite reductase (NADH) small subunit|uniref:Rieske (2Fe-2S) protein n=1 Tax=Prosthecochloris sp. HL-130-GSB TaxID=1974213 RepID=UPI000A1C05CE|nr:Rieske (2Fe-2S) protein [Prosthecochloris sp. HL-130-GSB]ARM30584.1 (2Fe-2S)-binding protein [Prosthecochloris sp. HL-130-GSB]MBO8093263.1 Rieske (2Fe-2S) protein [Prosthecochloris sp.]
MGWIKVLENDTAISQGDIIEVRAGGKSFAVLNIEGEVCVLDGTCPHEGGPLAKGKIEDGYLVCPWHGWEFDPFTGKDRYNPSRGVRSYSVEVRDDGVYVDV